KDYFAQFGFHCLLIKVIAGRVRKNRWAQHSFNRWLDLEGRSLKLSELDLRQRRTRILDCAMAGLSAELKDLLCQIAAFRYPLDVDTLFALNPFVKRYYVEPPKPPGLMPPDEFQRKRRELHDLRIEQITVSRNKESAPLVALKAKLTAVRAEL